MCENTVQSHDFLMLPRVNFMYIQTEKRTSKRHVRLKNHQNPNNLTFVTVFSPPAIAALVLDNRTAARKLLQSFAGVPNQGDHDRVGLCRVVHIGSIFHVRQEGPVHYPHVELRAGDSLPQSRFNSGSGVRTLEIPSKKVHRQVNSYST